VTTVIIRRGNDPMGRMRRMRVEIDGSTAAHLSVNSSESLDISSGNHILRARMDWQSSKPLRVALSTDETITVVVGSSWRMLTRIIGGWGTALDIHVA